jgi:hypothetical protein
MLIKALADMSISLFANTGTVSGKNLHYQYILIGILLIYVLI